MKKHLFTILVLTAATLLLQGCGGEQGAPKKAAVDVKAKAPSSAASKPATEKASTAAAQKAVDQQKPAGDAQKTAANVQKPAPGAPKSAADTQKATPAGAATKAPAPASQKAATEGQKAAGESEKAAPQKAEADAQKTAGATKSAAADTETQEPLSPLTVPRGYRYEPRGRRDPFVNPIPKPVATAARPLARPDGLPGVLVSELKVSGIIYAPDPTMKKAILAAGKKTYFAKQGDHLFDAVIREIRPNEVVFTMISTTTRQPLGRDTVVSTGATGRR
jgi:hypothetical protein